MEAMQGPGFSRQGAPIIRIAAIELLDFKSVAQGKACFSSPDAGGDILAVYGQNGSGKTALVQAVALLRHLLCASPLPDTFADCIDVASSCSALKYTLTMQFPSGSAPAGHPFGGAGDALTVFYSVVLGRNGRTADGKPTLCVSGESLLVEGVIGGKELPLQMVLDTIRCELSPKSRLLETFGRESLIPKVPMPGDLNTNVSFLFNTAFFYSEPGSLFYTLAAHLHFYGLFHLFVVDTVSDGIVRQNQALPVYTDSFKMTIPMARAFPADDKQKAAVEAYIAGVSRVMEEIVPGLRVQLRSTDQFIDENAKPVYLMMLVSVRGERELPLRCESDGVRHLLSVLWLLTWAYNDPRVTLAVDELDAGVFEYLLGELLQVFKDGGRGQLLFTAHNLRPLEVLDNDSILFTTTDPKNRYRKLTGLGKGENLRRAYYREILLHEHYDDLYAPTKRYRIAMAMASTAADNENGDADEPANVFDGEGR